MVMKQTAPKQTAPKPNVPLRYFKHQITGTVHEADPNWAPVMAGRSDLTEVFPEKETEDEDSD